MSDQVNPYAAPIINTPAATISDQQEVFMQGDLLIVPKNYTFPAICLRTGSTENLGKPYKRALTWYHPAWALLILTGLIIFLVVVLCIQKKGLIVFQLSVDAMRARRKKILIAWGIFFSSFGFFYLAGNFDQPWLIFVACSAILISLIMAASWCRLIIPAKIDDRFVYLRIKNQDLLKKIFLACNAARESALQPPAMPSL